MEETSFLRSAWKNDAADATKLNAQENLKHTRKVVNCMKAMCGMHPSLKGVLEVTKSAMSIASTVVTTNATAAKEQARDDDIRELKQQVEQLFVTDITIQNAMEREQASLWHELSMMKNAMMEQARKDKAMFEKITEEEAANWANLEATHHNQMTFGLALTESLAGLVRERFEAYKTDKFEWSSSQFLGHSTPGGWSHWVER